MRQFYPIILLIISNVFMTFAWYGHLNFKSAPLWLVVLASWGIAFLCSRNGINLSQPNAEPL